jgi:hypothetical protein
MQINNVQIRRALGLLTLLIVCVALAGCGALA